MKNSYIKSGMAMGTVTNLLNSSYFNAVYLLLIIAPLWV